jgi:adenylate cyclase, class 2
MHIEFETKVEDINSHEIEENLLKLGALKGNTKLMRRWVLDRSKGDGVIEFFRLRDDGEKVELTYKLSTGNNIGNTNEINVFVSDFEKTYEMLSKLEWTNMFYQENKRTCFKLNNIEFLIDEWPFIPPYLEIEADSIEKVNEGLKLLSLEGKDSGDISVKDIYSSHNLDLHSFKELRFH